MKKLMIFPVLAFLTIGYLKAEDKIEQNNEYTKIDENLNEWVLVKEDNGIKVYFMKVEEEGMCQIKIKFENTTNLEKSFSWVIKEGEKVINNQKLTISPNGVEIFIDYSVPILFSTNNNFNDFLITITK